MSWVIVTGANGGIGEATVHQLIKLSLIHI